MRKLNLNPCRICGKTKYLDLKLHSETKIIWIHCDECGNHVEPIEMKLGPKALEDKWNEENPK